MTDRNERAPSAFRLNLEQQKNRAKELLRAAKAGEAEALSRFAATHHGPVTRDAAQARVKLADAQLVIARELRFSSWARLKAHIQSMERERAAIDAKRPAPDADLKTLHIRCGHDIQERIAEAFVGDFWPYVTPFCVGPVSNGPDRNELMARYIVETFPEEDGSRTYEGEVQSLLDNERRLLRTADDYERVVIWKEQDTWCQTVLAHLLAHYASSKRPRVLELIALDEFPGAERFTGMGQLPAEALRLLWSSRKPVMPAQLALGKEVWSAFSSHDPRDLAALFRSGTPALPIMAPALHRLLRELPAVENGLRLTEQLILNIVSEGAVDQPMLVWMSVWPRFARRDPLPSSVTDVGFLGVINDMLAGPAPLLNFTRDPPLPGHTTALLPRQLTQSCRQILTVTEVGRAVLNGERDWHVDRPFPRWVGGVRIQPGAKGWRWDEGKRDV
ncbi:MAG TPA: hypothetical protein VI653_29785, partial [Steroidobacteraceae bacterium]